jgi:IclR family acetate operon transcriptional repressor
MTQARDTGSVGRRTRGRPRDWSENSDQTTIKALDRAMEVFEHLSTTPGSSLSALAADLDQSPSTVYRILMTLQARGLVEFDPTDQNWQIGARAFIIGARYLRRTSLVERARPIMRALMRVTGETANLGVQRGGQVLFLSQAETHESIRAFFPPGTLSPLHASGIGKALLAEMTEAQLADFLAAAPLERFTEFTSASPDAVRAEVAVTRAKGYAFDAEEKTLGMRCIAAAVFDHTDDAVAGISVSGPVSRIGDDQIDRLSASVMDAARALTAALGGSPR